MVGLTKFIQTRSRSRPRREGDLAADQEAPFVDDVGQRAGG